MITELGHPQFGRKISRSTSSAYRCIVLPVTHDRGVIEIMMSLTNGVMHRLLGDQNLMKFVKGVV